MVVEGLELQASPPNRPSKRKEGLEVELISKDQFLIIHDYINSVSIKSQNEAFKELQVGDLEGVRNIRIPIAGAGACTFPIPCPLLLFHMNVPN